MQAKVISVFAIFLFVASSGFGLYRVRQASAVGRHIGAGKRFAAAGDHLTAIASFSEAITTDPKCAEAYLGRGEAYENAWPSKEQLALEDYTAASQLDDTNANAYYLRASVYSRILNHVDGIKDFTQAIRRNPKHMRAYRERAMLAWDAGDSTQAISDASTAIQLAPEDDSNWYSRSSIHQLNGDYGQSVEDATEALRLRPSRDNYWRRAKAKIANRQIEEAVEDLKGALELDKDNRFLEAELASAEAAIHDTKSLELIVHTVRADAEFRRKVARLREAKLAKDPNSRNTGLSADEF